jgi:hypothetical protein
LPTTTPNWARAWRIRSPEICSYGRIAGFEPFLLDRCFGLYKIRPDHGASGGQKERSDQTVKKSFAKTAATFFKRCFAK